jgi:class 3 adenylate cyclase
MEVKQVTLVLVDISGYTHFIKHREISLLHAEQIITDLLEAVIDTAEYPLALNKLEGDAALLYTAVEAELSAVAQDVARQAMRFFEAFRRKRLAMVNDASCPCDACTHIDTLDLKAFLHVGEAVVKQVRQFEELGGEDVILVHRLLKNSVGVPEYLLMTKAFHQVSGDLPGWPNQPHAEEYEAIGRVDAVVFYPQGALAPEILAAGQVSDQGSRFELEPLRRSLTGDELEFRHLPR